MHLNPPHDDYCSKISLVAKEYFVRSSIVQVKLNDVRLLASLQY